MDNRILVTYATRAGSTAGVAEAIGEGLVATGADVDVVPMQAVREIAPYRAVIAGSAIQHAQWLPEALEFVELNRQVLQRKPFAAFLVCMTLAVPGAERYRQGVAGWLAPVRALVRPVAEGLFPGALELSTVPSFMDRLKFRLSITAGVWQEGDHRDWDAVAAWTGALEPRLSHI